MRISGCYSLHQSLTLESGAIVKQAVSLARKRGHAQVTPLHVATAMLSSPTTGLLKRVCLQSHSHPLQCKALEICFNVALNRLPALLSVSTPILGQHNYSHLPSLSNALVAAFKRAQAHQRRGGSSTENQQPILALKVEIEQLVISILDDPSVSRVMKEAGFSSTHVKNNVISSTQAVSSEKCSPQEFSSINIPKTSLSQFRFSALSSTNYAKCKTGKPSLENLHPLTIPVVNLDLGLSLENSDMHNQLKKESVDDDSNSWLFQKAGGLIKKQLICCSDCSDNFKKEAQLELMTTSCASTSKLPSWLQQYKDENRKQIHLHQEYCDDKIILHLCKKWNSICSSIHTKKPDFLGKLVVFNLSTSSSISSSPSSSTSVSSNGLHKPNKLHKNIVNPPLIFEKTSNELHQILPAPQKPDLLSNPNSSPNSSSSSEDNMELEFPHDHNKFNELNSDNLNILGNALEKKVPWQRCIIPDIISTILKCRSGMMTRNKTKNMNIIVTEKRQESWLLFMGADNDGKETIAKELAKAVFGSYNNFTAIGISSFSSTRNTTNYKKRARDEHGANSYDRFVDAVCYNYDPSRVFYVEDADEIDYDHSLKGFERAIKDGGFALSGGEFVPVKDAIIIFSCENFNFSPGGKNGKQEKEENSELLDLNIATEDGSDDDENSSVSEIGILDLVDQKVEFKIKVL